LPRHSDRLPQDTALRVPKFFRIVHKLSCAGRAGILKGGRGAWDMYSPNNMFASRAASSRFTMRFTSNSASAVPSRTREFNIGRMKHSGSDCFVFSIPIGKRVRQTGHFANAFPAWFVAGCSNATSWGDRGARAGALRSLLCTLPEFPNFPWPEGAA
jgi:hypothetical protein